MPEHVAYMSDATDYLKSALPSAGKYVLNKTLTGCGGTTYFLDLDLPLVLVSPRSNMLTGKHNDYKDSYLFRDPKDTQATPMELINNLEKYLSRCGQNPFGKPIIPKILVTVDSAHYVLDVLEKMGGTDAFTFVVDEFQNLVDDARFKAQTDYKFLVNLDARAKNICYLSATPIPETYLDCLQEFQDVDYYKLEWSPSVVIEPTINEVCMKKGEDAKSICLGIIQDYKSKDKANRYFETKVWNGQQVFSREAVFYLNEVRTIEEIIEEAGLCAKEVKILVAGSNEYARKLKKAGFLINEDERPRGDYLRDPTLTNKPFTFCSKASFEGRDFYSHSASTYIFVNGAKDWQTLDTDIDIPQILGRQRLPSNPFRYNATIFYKTKPVGGMMTEQQFLSALREEVEPDNDLVKEFHDAKDEETARKKYKQAVKYSKYDDSFIAIIDSSNGNGIDVRINELKIAARHGLWMLKNFYYNSPLQLIGQLQQMMQRQYGTKPDALRWFEIKFRSQKDFAAKMKLYADFIDAYPTLLGEVQNNPYIDIEFHKAYIWFGSARLAALNYDEAKILNVPYITSLCQSVFVKGNWYSNREVKAKLQMIYDKLELGKTAKANELGNYISCTPKRPQGTQGKQEYGYEII